MAGTTGNNSVNSTDGPEGLPTMADVSFEDMPKEMLKLFKEVESYVDRISKTWKDAIDETSKVTGELSKDKPGSGRLGLGSFTRAEKIQGLGLGVMAAGSAYMSMAPNTMAAVTQRIGADTYAGMSGMSSRQAIMQANAQVRGGATSAYGPTMAAMNLYSMGGYTANSLSSKNIMSQLGGLSAMTGMSNEQAAASVAGINGMNFLRMGVRVRDSKGNMLPPNQIINSVFNSLTRGGKITPEQAAAGFLNPGGKGYATLQAITGGDQALMATLQSGIMARAKKGSAITASDMKDPNKILNAMGVDQSSPLRANFRYNSSENRKLQATEQGLVGGYDASLRTTAALNDGYSKMAELLGPVNQGLMTLKGILQTFPQTGGMGGTISSLAGTGMGMLGHGMQMNMMSKVLARQGGAAGEEALLAGKMGMTMGKFGGYAGVAAASLAGGYLIGKGGKWLGNKLHASKGVTRGGSVLAGAGTGAAIGAGIGSVVPILGTGVGAVVGGIAGAIGGWFGSDGGEAPTSMNLGTGAGQDTHTPSKHHIVPVPKGTPVTSHFGPRPAAARAAAAQGRHISSNHKGTDFGVKSGTSITSAADGVVVEIGNQAAGWGNYVLIQHADGTKTRYAHLRRIGVSRNQKIKAGQVIGLSGGGPRDPGRGNAGAAHLHFEALNKAGVNVNPEAYLSGAGAQPSPTPAPSPTSGTKNFLSNGKGSTLDPHTGELSTPGLAALLGDSGAPLSWKRISKKYGSSNLASIVASVPEGFKGKPTENKKHLIQTIARHGFHGDALRTAYAISLAESGGRPNAVGDVGLQTEKWGPSIGLFQIRSLRNWKAYNDQYRDATRLPNPDFNAAAAFMKSNQGTNFKAWSTYTSGSFLKHLGEADVMAHAAGIGGEVGGLNLPHHTSSTHTASSGVGGVSLNNNSNVVIKLYMDVKIANSSIHEAERMVRMVGEKLKSDGMLKKIGASL